MLLGWCNGKTPVLLVKECVLMVKEGSGQGIVYYVDVANLSVFACAQGLDFTPKREGNTAVGGGAIVLFWNTSLKFANDE
jgi:hypothetical protein